MKERFKKLPPTLQKQVIIRLGASLLSLMLFSLTLILYRDIYLSLSFAVLLLLFGVSGTIFLIKLSDGKYVVIEGKCSKVERTVIRKRAKTLYLNCKPHTVKVNSRQKLKNIEAGDLVTLYVSESTPVYEMEGCQLLSGYLALDFLKGSDENDNQ